MAGGRWAWAVLAALLLAGGCGGAIEDLLDGAAGDPGTDAVTGAAGQDNAPVPAGPHLYCITNIGHTMVAFSLEQGAVLTETRRVLELDPVGPWFVAGRGYYLSRVETSGAGANALIEFDPATLAEQRRLSFPGNSNPTTMLPLPGTARAYVLLRGSTFDNFASNGLAVVDLEGLAQTGYLDFNDPAQFVAGEALTSAVGLAWDAGCALGAPCAYVVMNNWRNAVREGWLVVLEPAGADAPIVRDAVPLGLNPEPAVLLDGEGELWMVNNGGFAQLDGEPGTLQVLDTAAFADGVADNETVAVLEIGGDPTGIYPFSATEGWVTTFPDDEVRAVDLAGNALDPAGADPPVLTGPLLSTDEPAPALFAGLGGFGAAGLGELDPSTGALVAEHDLESGNGDVSCAPFTNP